MTTDRTPDEIRIELQRVHRRMRALWTVAILAGLVYLAVFTVDIAHFWSWEVGNVLAYMAATALVMAVAHWGTDYRLHLLWSADRLQAELDAAEPRGAER